MPIPDGIDEKEFWKLDRRIRTLLKSYGYTPVNDLVTSIHGALKDDRDRYTERKCLEARIEENKQYMQSSSWYYPSGPDVPHIPVKQIENRIAILQKELESTK